MTMMEERYNNEQINNTVKVLRAISIVCVATAHCDPFSNHLLECLRRLIGTIGVPAFLICSGYYFKQNESAKVFWCKKIKKIVIPWVLWGLITYLINCHVYANIFSLFELCLWTLGFKTWLYFVPVLLICFGINRISDRNVWLGIQLFISYVMWVLCYLKVIPEMKFFTYYQNPLIHLQFFTIGRLLAKYKISRMLKPSIKEKVCFLIATCFIGFLYTRVGEIGYWKSLYSIPFELLCVLLIFWVSYSLKKFRLLQYIGMKSYFIYFVHLQIGNTIVNKLLSMIIPGFDIESILFFLKPLFVVLLCFAIYYLLKRLFKLLNIDNITWILSL